MNFKLMNIYVSHFTETAVGKFDLLILTHYQSKDIHKF